MDDILALACPGCARPVLFEAARRFELDHGRAAVEDLLCEIGVLSARFEERQRTATNIRERECLVYAIDGTMVRELLRGHVAAGYHRIGWDGRDQRGLTVPSGIYLCAMKTGDFWGVVKLNLIK